MDKTYTVLPYKIYFSIFCIESAEHGLHFSVDVGADCLMLIEGYNCVPWETHMEIAKSDIFVNTKST